MISLSMIAKDEEANISNAILSVKDIVDEIIVVDTGSKDNTKKIVTRLGAKVFDFRWLDDFSAARNFSKSKCNGEWIIVLDADEIISKSDHEKIHNLTKVKESIAYRFIQRTYLNSISRFKWNDNDDIYPESRGYLGWQYRGIVRLFRNVPEINFIYPIHETVKPSVLKIGKITNSSIPIHHFPFGQKNDFYLRLLQKKILEYPIANSFAELSVHLYEMGKYEESKKYASLAKKMNPRIVLG